MNGKRNIKFATGTIVVMHAPHGPCERPGMASATLTCSPCRETLELSATGLSLKRNFPREISPICVVRSTRFHRLDSGSVFVAGGPEWRLKREAVRLLIPKVIGPTAHTVPTKVLEITAPADGVVRHVLVKSGSKVMSQAEACRFDDEAQKLVVDRAKANLAAAKTELKIAAAKKPTRKNLPKPIFRQQKPT